MIHWKAHKKIAEGEGEVIRKFKQSLTLSWQKNEGYDMLTKINNVLNGDQKDDLGSDPTTICAFKYASVTSCEVSMRTISSYKYLLSDRRQCLTIDNLKKYFVSSNEATYNKNLD